MTGWLGRELPRGMEGGRRGIRPSSPQRSPGPPRHARGEASRASCTPGSMGVRPALPLRTGCRRPLGRLEAGEPWVPL